MALFFMLYLFVAGSCGEISSEKKTIKRYVPLDKIGGGVVLREIKEETTYQDNPNMLKSINLNDFDNNALRYVKRNFDEIDRAGFRSMGKRNFFEIDQSDFGKMGQRNLDETYGSGFLNMKRNFDEIDRTGFRSMEKRNSDKIVRTGLRKMEKREFDETDKIGFISMEEENFDQNDKRFQSTMKKNFDEIDRAGFGSMGKRNFDKTGKTQLQNRSTGKNFVDIDSLRPQNKDLNHFYEVDGKNLPNKQYLISSRQNFDVINKFRNMKKRSYNQKEIYDDKFMNRSNP